MISIIFATFNGKRTLPTMLDAMGRLERPVSRLEIIAVDNGSEDGALDLLREHAQRLPLTVLEQPLRGKNRALNMGIERARGELIVLTDDDVVPDPDWLLRLEQCASEQASVDLFGGVIAPHWETRPPDWIFDSVPLGVTFVLTAPDLEDGPIFPGLIWGANMMVRRRVFDAGHRFNETVGPSAGQYIMGSETEFNIRMARHGFKTWFCSKARVGHIIRDFQMQKHWVVQRAFRFGRNKCLQDFGETGNTGSAFFGFARFPKWMLRNVVEETLRGHLDRLFGREKSAVARLWDAAYYRGYIHQALQLHAAGSAGTKS